MTTHVTPYFAAKGASDAIAFYTKAFAAVERYRIPDGDGQRLGHAEFTIGDTTLYISDEYPDFNALAHPASFVIELPDVDAAFQRAVDAGATVERPLADAPYGRGGWLRDPFGHRWNVMTPNPDFDPKDMQ